MRLTEFYALEARSERFVLEPEVNGTGRLLAWERVEYAADGAEEQDTGFEVVAHGDLDKLLSKLTQLAPETMGREDAIRELFEQAIEDGHLVVSIDDSGVNLVPKAPKDDDGWDPTQEIE